MALPDLTKLGAVKQALSVVEDRIFTIELYCGILEDVKQIAEGEPAPLATPITVTPEILSAPARTGFTVVEWGGTIDVGNKSGTNIPLPGFLDLLL